MEANERFHKMHLIINSIYIYFKTYMYIPKGQLEAVNQRQTIP